MILFLKMKMNIAYKTLNMICRYDDLICNINWGLLKYIITFILYSMYSGRQPINEDSILAIWIMTLIGLLMSTTLCGFVIHTIVKNKLLDSIFFKVQYT